MSVTGDRRHLDRLRRMRNPRAVTRIGQAVFVAAVEVQAEARRLISEGSVSGKEHVPSEPGEPPNFDTGHLSGNIEAVRTGPLTAIVESRASYAVPLEVGTDKMAARPYMGPASANKRRRVVTLIQKVMNSIVNGG